MTSPENKAIVFFDGVCNFCNSTIQFALKRDKKDFFRFSTIQSEKGREFLPNTTINTSDPDSVVLLLNGKVYDKSSAILLIAKKLGGIWSLAMIFWIIPKFLRDAAYMFIAKNRYKWFGKKETCMIPSPEQRAKFL